MEFKKWPTENEEEFRKHLESEKMLRRRAFYDIMMAHSIYKKEKIVTVERTGDCSYRLVLQKGARFRALDIEDLTPFYHGCARDLMGFKKSFFKDKAYDRCPFEKFVEKDRDRVMTAAWEAVDILHSLRTRVTRPVLTECLLEAREKDPSLFAEAAEDGKLPTIERNFFMYGSIPIPIEAKPDIKEDLPYAHHRKLHDYLLDRWNRGGFAEDAKN